MGRKIINVLISGDNRIGKYFSVLMTSVFENHKDYDVHFWLLHHRIGEEDLALASNAACRYKQHFHSIVYNPKVFSHYSFSDEWPSECFYWLLAHQYLPSEVERAIYLDSDTLVCGDFTEFYFADFEDNFLLAAGSGDKQEKVRLVTDMASRVRCSTHNNAYCIFCTGSLVINLAKFRSERITIETLVEANEQRLKTLKISELFADQGLANYLFYDKTKFFPGKFQSAIWGQTKESFDDIRVFHFMGRPKPWEEYFEAPFYNKYSPNVFENMPYWVNIIQKWWRYAELVDNYETLLFEAKEIFYKKIEHLFRKYVSQKSIANILKKRINTNFPLQVVFPQSYVPEADATTWSQVRAGNYRLFEKVSNSNYKKVKFPLLSLLASSKRYKFEILAHANKSFRLPLILSDYSCSKAQFLFTIALTENKNRFSYQFSPNSDVYDCLYFDSTKVDVGTKIIVYEISLAEIPPPPPNHVIYSIPSYGIPEKNTSWKNESEGGTHEKELSEYKKMLKKEFEKTDGKRGAIVMNCNPFTLGHRYLIEYAASRVKHLYIFVVEEDKSIFPFADRFDLIKRGIVDLQNVTVLPSGKFIISSFTFADYFNKSELQDRIIDPSQDVTLFAEEIAPVLNITVRFAGEEPLDNVTRQYNAAMREILPKYGVCFEVIPQKGSGDVPISASRVRAFLKEGNFEEIAKLVPKTTLEYLKGVNTHISTL